ncbi:MAG: hypothetical protein FJY82_10975 [Candidatus Aminicenantes bacterium]|nr:hypothetical protein [Candidatus Aminicenantes bacterium]
MKKIGRIALGMLLVSMAFQGCKSHPEKGLLDRYFNAISLNDVTTMSTMAVDPIRIDFSSWKIVSVSEEKIVPATLPDLNATELDLKKQLEQHVGPTLDAKDALDVAKDEYTGARSAAARAAAKAKMDAAQTKYDEEYKLHQDLQRRYNETKAAASKEEEITNFSLGAGQLPNIRDLKGNIHSKVLEVEVIQKDGQAKKYQIMMMMYRLKDEVTSVSHNGRWVITRFETL